MRVEPQVRIWLSQAMPPVQAIPPMRERSKSAAASEGPGLLLAGRTGSTFCTDLLTRESVGFAPLRNNNTSANATPVRTTARTSREVVCALCVARQKPTYLNGEADCFAPALSRERNSQITSDARLARSRVVLRILQVLALSQKHAGVLMLVCCRNFPGRNDLIAERPIVSVPELPVFLFHDHAIIFR